MTTTDLIRKHFAFFVYDIELTYALIVNQLDIIRVTDLIG